MIISASRRTDIPAFYGEWFKNRLQEGVVGVRNPLNWKQTSHLTISPSVVDCFVFWTKNPAPFFSILPLLNGYAFYFLYTITGYDEIIEMNVPSLEKRIETFMLFSKSIGPERMIWRYDPIIFSDRYTTNFHLSQFKTIASALQGYTYTCIISFVTLYKKCINTMAPLKVLSEPPHGKKNFVFGLSTIADALKITVQSCAGLEDLSKAGVVPGACIDAKLIAQLNPKNKAAQKDANQRPACLCTKSIDIGSYNTCMHNCLYCYANTSSSTIIHNYQRHDPCGLFLHSEKRPSQ